MNWNLRLAQHCDICGEHESRVLLGSFRRYRGGYGNVSTVECRTDREACWARHDMKEAARSIQPDRAA